jgi:hypothetical protein
VPAVAVSEPPTERSDVIEKLLLVEIVPGTFKALTVIVPAPLIVFEVPDIVIVPEVADNEPFTVKFPAIVYELVVPIEPERVRLLKDIPVPLIVFDAPLIVTVPAPPVV